MKNYDYIIVGAGASGLLMAYRMSKDSFFDNKQILIIDKEQKLDDTDEVLNGIAFDKENNRLFVTGKHWGKLYEIELIKK